LNKILIVDDNEDLRFNLSAILDDEGYTVKAVEDGANALKEVGSKTPPDLVLLDMKLPDMDGIKVLEEIRKLNESTIILMLTAYGDVKSAVHAMKIGALDYLTKPFDNEEIVLVIKRALENKNLSDEVKRLREELNEKKASGEGTLGSSPSIIKIIKQVEVVAPTDMSVVIQGESGTGKEVFSNLIHKKSLRKDKPFIAIDCGALPESLIESELFGFEKGAFTGADSAKEGKFEQANGGTLFLDEITNLSDANQVKLLRVIQEKKLTRLGGKKEISINVRIISATNKRMVDAVAEGKFRSDLYYRLNEFHIDLPPLKERKDDIPMLATHFLNEANKELNKDIKGFSAEIMKALLSHSWPGNIRELRNIVRKAVLLTGEELVTEVDLPIDNHMNPVVKDGQESISLAETSSIEDVTNQVEKELILKALKQTNNNKVKAAEILKINRKTLYRKMKSLGL
jgi:two-component system response regulator AtoC